MTTYTRRHFFGTVAAAAAAGLVHTVQAQGQPPTVNVPTQIFKARITDIPTDSFCESLKAAGFSGMEVTKWDASVEEAQKSRLIAEKHGLRIHSVMRGWANFNQPDQFDSDIKSVETALRAASVYGADAILLVPCRIGGMKMPEPWDFDIDFDPKTLKVKTVAVGNNASYADYITAQNTATESTIRAIETLTPVAAREGVRITIENVWNNLWCTPKFFAAFCKYFDHPWVGCYFDLGNHVKYARCEEWVQALGNSIVKLHIKGYKVTEAKGKLGGGSGDWCKIDESSIDWKAVRKQLAENRYSGWMTTEEDERPESNAEYSRMLNKIIEM